MGLRMSVKSDGLLKSKIENLLAIQAGFNVRVSQIVRGNAFDVVLNAKNLVPHSTGALQRSIQPTFLNGGLSALIGSFLPYAARQEFDALLDHSVRPPRRRKINTKSGRKGSIIKGTGQDNPNATFGFLRKSLYIVAPFFLDDLQQEVNRFGDAWSGGTA